MSQLAPVIVEGGWDLAEASKVRIKLELYFGSQKKSSGGECRVQTDDGAPRAAVYFVEAVARARVLQKQDHVITLNNQLMKLRLSEPSSSGSSDVTAPEGDPVGGASADNQDEAGRSTAVVLDNMTDIQVVELVVLGVMGLDNSTYTVEMIPEISAAVVTFSNAADKDRFLAASRSSQALERRRMTARPLEAAVSVWVENLSPTVNEEILELYFQKWTPPNKKWRLNEIIITPHRAAVVTVGDPEVVRRICLHEDHKIRSASLKVYPYYESLRCPLYGKDRPVWKMPEPFTETLEQALCKFLQSKKLWKVVEEQMEQHFCSVSVEEPLVKLSPLPSFLKQAGLTAERVEEWKSTAQRAFWQLLSQYATFQCPMNAPAWTQAEPDMRSALSPDALVLMDAASESLIVVGKAEDIERIKDRVKKIAASAMKKIQQKREEVTEAMDLAPTVFHILEKEGLQRAARDISSDLELSYDNRSHTLTFRGTPADVFKAKAWVLERKFSLNKKQIDLPPVLLDFLKTVDSEDISKDLFTSKGTSATYSIVSDRVLLLGRSDSVLADAEQKMRAAFSQQTLDVEDPEVLRLPAWTSLKQRLLEDNNSSKTTVAIVDQGGDQVTVVGYLETVEEVSRALQPFIVDNSRVEEVIRVQSCTLQFMVRKKKQDYTGIAAACGATVQIDEGRPSVSITGARFQVLNAKALIQELLHALITDNLVVDKPGAKKYFQAQGSLFLSSIINDLNCVVLLQPQRSAPCLCRVSTPSGVQLSASEADICALQVDAVVNPANEDLHHIGGLALALLKAAGPELKNISNRYVAANGALRPGQAVATDACRLPCKHVIHAVGPRFSDHSREDSVLLLKRAVVQSLREAQRLDCTTVAMPAISSGMFGFPLELCADTIAQAVWEHCGAAGGRGALREVQLVANNQQTAAALAAAVKKVSDNLGQAGASGGQAGQGQSHSPRSAEKGGLKGTGGTPKGAGNHGDSGGQSSGDLAGPEGCVLVEGATAEGLRVVLWKGNIEAQTSCVIVNTISETMDLNQGAVSKAILAAAGRGLQSAILREARLDQLDPGSLVVTDAFSLACQKVFHTVCPSWSASAQAEKTLTSIICQCLTEAERLKMKSLSFPAIGTGVLNFPRDVVARILLREVQTFSRKKTPQHLAEVFIVVHPSDSRTERSLRAEFSSQLNQKNLQAGSQQPQSSTGPSSSQSQKATVSTFSQVVSTSLGAYQMQMGPLTFEVLSGDITRETCDVIINSSNRDFTLKSGVSKAILDAAGAGVEVECAQQARAQGHQPGHVILTSAGRLPSKAIVHVVVASPADIKSTAYAVLKLCEEKSFQAAAFPALGTGRGGVSPATVADAMVGAVADFAKKQPKSIRLVRIVIFQTEMLAHFHSSMMKVQGEPVKNKGVFGTIRDAFSSLFGNGEEKPSRETLVLQKEEFEPAVFELCGENKQDVDLAKKRILELIQNEQATRTIKDENIRQLTQAHMVELENLQKQLTISIHLNTSLDEEEPSICLEGLTRDVFSADPVIRNLLHRVQQVENQKHKAAQMSECVEWRFQDQSGQMVAFDPQSNLLLEEALLTNKMVKVKINGENYHANPVWKKALCHSSHEEVELLRVDKKEVLPACWTHMGDSLHQLVSLASNSKDYKDVEQKTTSGGLRLNILKIERVQNVTLWQNYQVLKKSMEKKNGHTDNEKQLFHGTGASSVDFINKHGFNRGYAGTHGAMYGNGAYFAIDPTYSARGYAKPDAQGHRRMYLARVLVGDFTKGQQGLVAPPARDPARPSDLYDSVSDRVVNPSMFVIFNDVQAYPEFLITFTLA